MSTFIKATIVVICTLVSASNAFADTCEISVRDSFLNANIYSKQDASSVYAIMHNAAGRYEASFELYNISGCREVSSGTMGSLTAVEEKMKSGGYEKVFSLDSGKYFDLNGKQTFLYSMSLVDDEIIVEKHNLDAMEQKLIHSVQEDSDVIWLDGAYTKRQSEIFKAPEFWKRMSDESHIRGHSKYYIHRWTLNKEDVSDLEDFLAFSDIPDWSLVVMQLMKLKYGEQPETTALLKYIDDYPRGEYKVAAFEKAAKNSYAAAKQENTVAAYENYWAKYSSSRYAKRMKSRFDKALFLAKKNGAIQGGSVATVEQLYLKSMDADLKNKLISLKRAKNTLTGYIAAYKYSKASVDLNAILGIYRAKKTLAGYQSAYKYSGASKDLDSILQNSNSILALEGFLKSYGKKKQAAKAKDKLVVLYRKEDTFDGYLKAYKLLSVPGDGEMAVSKAKTTNEKGQIEKAAFLKVKNKRYLVRSDMKLGRVSYSDGEKQNMGFFSNYEFWGGISPSVQVSANFIDGLPFQPVFGVYDISMTLSFYVPLNRQLRSKWAGNKDTTEAAHAEKTIHFRLKPPYTQKRMNVTFDSELLAYFDRGSAGGYTAKWPSDDANVAIKSVIVSFSGIQEKVAGKLNINFKEVESIRDTSRYVKVNIDGSYRKGLALINQFSEIDTGRVNRAASYAGSSSGYSQGSSASTSPNARSTPSSSSSSNSSSSGVKEVYNGGYKSAGGYVIYKVKCNNGRSASAFQDGSGWWKDGGGSSYGNKYRNLSKGAFAQRFCN